MPLQRKPIHISDIMRADIKRRDWSACHIAGDRNPPVTLSEWRMAVRAAFSAKARRDG